MIKAHQLFLSLLFIFSLRGMETSYEILDGKKVAQQMQDDIKKEVEVLTSNDKRPPSLVVILVGDDNASKIYVRFKKRGCEYVGFTFDQRNFTPDITEDELLQEIDAINGDDTIDGLIVQLPLPVHIAKDKVLQAVDPKKDVDGFHPLNVGKLTLNLPTFLPATPFGILKLLGAYNIATKGKHCVVVGCGTLVGSPLSVLMRNDQEQGNSTVTVCHEHTKDLATHTRMADILVVAVGKAGLITGDMVKEGVVVIDAGISRVPSKKTKSGSKLKGDVRFKQVARKARYITPVPGGVGPMTVAALLLNTLKSAKKEVYH